MPPFCCCWLAAISKYHLLPSSWVQVSCREVPDYHRQTNRTDKLGIFVLCTSHILSSLFFSLYITFACNWCKHYNLNVVSMKDSVDILIKKKCYVKRTYLALLFKNYVLNQFSQHHTLKKGCLKKAVFLPSLTAFMTFKKGGEIGFQFQDHGYFSAIVSHVGSLCVQERPFSASKRLIITTTHFEDLHFSDPVDKDIPQKKNVLQLPGASYTLKFSGHNP